MNILKIAFVLGSISLCGAASADSEVFRCPAVSEIVVKKVNPRDTHWTATAPGGWRGSNLPVESLEKSPPIPKTWASFKPVLQGDTVYITCKYMINETDQKDKWLVLKFIKDGIKKCKFVDADEGFECKYKKKK
jgi:hypothetical protein